MYNNNNWKKKKLYHRLSKMIVIVLKLVRTHSDLISLHTKIIKFFFLRFLYSVCVSTKLFTANYYWPQPTPVWLWHNDKWKKNWNDRHPFGLCVRWMHLEWNDESEASPPKETLTLYWVLSVIGYTRFVRYKSHVQSSK